MIRSTGNLVLDLDSHVVDVAVAWGKRNLLEGFELVGRTHGSVSEWSSALMQGGRELTEAHFEGNGIELDLSGSHFLGAGFAELEGLMMAVKKDITITTLRLDWSMVGDAGTNMLAGALLRNRTLRQVALCENGIGDEGAEALAAALDQNPSLQKLDLSKNAIGPRGAAQLAGGLERNRGLRELELKDNPLEDDGVESLAQAIDPDTAGAPVALRKLGLADCRMGDDAAARIAKAFKARGSSLTAVDLGARGELKRGVDPQERGEKFVVSCSSAGVQVAAYASFSRGQVTWTQDKESIHLVIQEPWLGRCDPASVQVELGAQALRAEVKGRRLADIDLFGKIQPKDCVWSLTEGTVQVTLRKELGEKWRSLSRVAAGGGGI